MGCNQSTLKQAKPVAGPAVVEKKKQAAVVTFATPVAVEESVATPAPLTAEAETIPVATEAVLVIVEAAAPVEEPVASIPDPEEPVAAAEPIVEATQTATTPQMTEVIAAPVTAESSPVPSPKRAAFGVCSTNASPVKATITEKIPTFSEFLAAQSAISVSDENAAPMSNGTKKKVAFDSETMRRSAPRTAAPAPASLSKKQKELVRKGHVSQGRRGPVAPKGSKGAIAQMQTEKYLEMAAAFERLLTNAATINAHLDTR